MTTHRLVVLSSAVDGCDEEFNDWYDNVHLGDVLAVPGVVAVQRFRLDDGSRWRYLAIYDLACEGGDPRPVTDEIMARAGTDAMVLSDAFDMEGYFMATATPIGPVRRSADPA